MGVKGLWSILAPHAICEPLYKLKGEKVAIDLSGWICDSQSFAEKHNQSRLYLRNLYFRASYLILSGITPVFVLEGEAPKLKHDTMANRNLIQNQNYGKSSAQPKGRLKKQCTDRRRFKSVLTQCEILLKSMGLECIKGVGEAEAMCAHLNSTGAVSAVISQDSDCFVYGATKVYKNFSVSNSGTSATSCGSVEVYDMKKIKLSLDFGRNKMVALALLCGSDYNGNGIEGVGCSTAANFLLNCSNDTVLDRLKSWISNPEMFENFAEIIDGTKYCTGCGHLGNIRSHTRVGCPTCNTTSGCDQSDYKKYYQNLKTELNIRGKVLKNPDGFPNTDIINEYLVSKEVVPKNFNPLWNKPDLIKFVKLMCSKLKWTEIYCVEKFLPMLTKWQLMYKAKDCVNIELFLGIDPDNNPDWLKPIVIKKKRNLKGIPCYEIVWKDVDGYYEGLIPIEQINDANEEEIWTTTEQQDLVAAAYPDLVEQFLNKNRKTKKKTNLRKKSIENNMKITDFLKRTESENGNMLSTHDRKMENINISMHNLSINVIEKCTSKTRKRKMVSSEISFKTKPLRKYKKKQSQKLNPSQKKIDSFVNAKISSANNSMINYECDIDFDIKVLPSVNDSFINMRKEASVFQLSNKLNTSGLFHENSLSDDIDDNEISLIIDNIVNRNENCYESFLKSKCSSPLHSMEKVSTPLHINSTKRPKNLFNRQQLNSSPLCSSFFEHLNRKPDAFEKSFKELNNASNKHASVRTSRKLSWAKAYSSLNNSYNVSFQY